MSVSLPINQLMTTDPIQVGSGPVPEGWWDSVEEKYPLRDKRWRTGVNKSYRYFVFEYPRVIEEKKDPLHNELDPWVRPIRPWTFYIDDNPLIWQSHTQEHPSRNAMFMPTCPRGATHYAWTSIDEVWFPLYLVLE